MHRSTFIRGVFVCGLLVCGFVEGPHRSVLAEAPKPLVVHEWGTFTALLDEQGEQLMGINVDTEPVPGFVHNLGRFLLNRSVLSSQHWVHRQKAVPRNHPQVTLRLETPVIYFYPSAGAKLPLTVDVRVKFLGGWLTEFYPNAQIQSPPVQNGKFEFTDLTPQTVGDIAWRNLRIGTDGEGPKTNEHVWLAPRNVAAATVTTPDNEHEKYVFYRGVAHQQAPLRVTTDKQGESLTVLPTFREILSNKKPVVIPHLWLMEARPDGELAYRKLDPLTVVNDGSRVEGMTARRRFSEAGFDVANRTRLEAEMSDVLLQEGLFADEVRALLSTWQQAYFISPGLRIFYTVPREWTDHYLPLEITGDPQVTRVMIGRVELISDSQRRLLHQLVRTPVSKGDWLRKIQFGSREFRKLLSGQSDFGDLGVPIPPDFQIYLDLGRFRNALVAAEEKRLNSANLSQFIRENNLEPFRLAQESGK